MLPAILHTLAFIVGLGVQSMGSPLAGSWLFFHLSACGILLYQGGYPAQKGVLWYASLAWLVTLGASTFLFASVAGAGAVMWILAAMPSLALCLRKEHLKPYFGCFLAVITVYALGLIAQQLLDVRYDHYSTGGRRAWPLLDPNNGAAVINLGFLPCVYLTLFKDRRWAVLCGVFAWALWITGSKAGIGAASCGIAILFSARCHIETVISVAAVALVNAVMVYFYRPELILLLADSLRDRFPIWEASWPLVWARPWGGLGLGMFGPHYQAVRTETYTGGWYAHNDLLQFAIEVGVPAAFVFCGLALAAALTTCRRNLVSGVVLLAVFLEAMVEFQFYVPSVSIPMGLALAYHMLNRNPKGFAA